MREALDMARRHNLRARDAMGVALLETNELDLLLGDPVYPAHPIRLMGGLLAVLCLMIAKATFVDPLEARFALLAAPKTIDFRMLIGFLMLSCVAVSAIGSGLTLRRFLRV